MLKIAAALAVVVGILGLLDFDRFITAVLTFAVAGLIIVSLPRGERRR